MGEEPLRGSWVAGAGGEAPPPFAVGAHLAVPCEAGGGMEYAGAAMTSLPALGHEITHSRFARGVMPANGNAGWIDEAVASWRDRGYPRAAAPAAARVHARAVARAALSARRLTPAGGDRG